MLTKKREQQQQPKKRRNSEGNKKKTRHPSIRSADSGRRRRRFLRLWLVAFQTNWSARISIGRYCVRQARLGKKKGSDWVSLFDWIKHDPIWPSSNSVILGLIRSMTRSCQIHQVSGSFYLVLPGFFAGQGRRVYWDSAKFYRVYLVLLSFTVSNWFGLGVLLDFCQVLLSLPSFTGFNRFTSEFLHWNRLLLFFTGFHRVWLANS